MLVAGDSLSAYSDDRSFKKFDDPGGYLVPTSAREQPIGTGGYYAFAYDYERITRELLLWGVLNRANERQSPESEDDAKPHLAAVHLFVSLGDFIQRVFLDHWMNAAQRTKFQSVL